MAADPNFINPLANPILLPIIYRFGIVFLAGLILIFVLNKFKFKGIWKTNLGKRYFSWLIIAVIYTTAVLFGGYPALAVLLLFMILALWEVSKIAKLPKMYSYSLYFLAGASIYVSSFHPKNFYMLPLFYFIVLGIISIRENKSNGFSNLSLSLFATIWIIFSLSHFILLGHLNNEIDSTKSLLILVALAVSLSDIGAYIVGKGFSKTFLNKYKIAEKISPNKTYAGILGNILGAGAGVAIMYFAIKSYLTISQMIVLSILIGLFSVVGDLTESLFKRYYNRKNSSSIIPGHGGILDRIDSVLRVILIIYYYLIFTLPFQ